ncbi:MAG: hypothetical protein C0490_18655, partial [Marivirga sp.]|nr:hypothetical protein [Marivirga sp.]
IGGVFKSMNNIEKVKLRGILNTYFEILEKEKAKHNNESFQKLVEDTREGILNNPENYFTGISPSFEDKMLIEALFDEYFEDMINC